MVLCVNYNGFPNLHKINILKSVQKKCKLTYANNINLYMDSAILKTNKVSALCIYKHRLGSTTIQCVASTGSWTWLSMMKMVNIAPRAGIEPTSLAFQATP